MKRSSARHWPHATVNRMNLAMIPDGFYLVDDSANPQPAFQDAINLAVAKVTHIAMSDMDGTIIGSPVVAEGVIRYPLVELGLCAGITGARYTTTTEVYPDSPRFSCAMQPGAGGGGKCSADVCVGNGVMWFLACARSALQSVLGLSSSSSAV